MAPGACQRKIEATIRERGPLSVAAFMDLALYDPECGYYARAARRTGRAGDFFTSVDVGPLFGQLLAFQLAEFDRILNPPSISRAETHGSAPAPGFDLVEAGASNGRLSGDILGRFRSHHPDLYARTRLHLVEASAAARAAQPETLQLFPGRLVSQSADAPAFEGALIANELLDALPVHQVVMRQQGLREVFVAADPDGRLTTLEGPPSTPELAEYLARLDVRLPPGCHAEINLRAMAWIAEVAGRLRRGFLLLVDYGHAAAELYSGRHGDGTLTTYSRHQSTGPDLSPSGPAWLQCPGDRDITADVDFTSLRAAAEQAGCTTLGLMDQTYFLLGLLEGSGVAHDLMPNERRALKTLIMPGGLGSTMKVLILGKGVGTPLLAGTTGTRLT